MSRFSVKCNGCIDLAQKQGADPYRLGHVKMGFKNCCVAFPLMMVLGQRKACSWTKKTAHRSQLPDENETSENHPCESPPHGFVKAASKSQKSHSLLLSSPQRLRVSNHDTPIGLCPRDLFHVSTGSPAWRTSAGSSTALAMRAREFSSVATAMAAMAAMAALGYGTTDS